MRECHGQAATTPPEAVDRRHVLKCTPVLLLAATACHCSATDFAAPPPRPPGVPVSAFGASTTAEAVTAGLDLTGKLALVTGATSGLGLETARVLALRGAQVIVGGRTLERAEAACRSLAQGRTVPLTLELEDWPGIVAAAAAVTAMGKPLDILICNAGVMTPRTLRLVNGVEQQFAVNHLGHFILCNRLQAAVAAAPQGRVVVVSSAAHGFAPDVGIDFDNLDGRRGYDPMKMYGQSKLANALFAFALARRTRGTRVTANTLHPGVVLTRLDRAGSAAGRLRARLMSWNNPRVKSVEAGAATQVYLATAQTLAQVTGRYFEDCNPVVPEGPHIGNAELGEALWARSETLTAPYLS